MDLEHLRSKIDAVDDHILQLLNNRYELVRQVAAVKRREGVDFFDPNREKTLLARLCEKNPGPIKDETLRAVYREILSGSLALEQPLTVAFLGPATTFTHQAALRQFGHSVRYLAQQTIPDVFESVIRDRARFGVVPVENSTEGAVTHTLDMFTDISIRICAEINMAVHHNLLAACEKDAIRVIYSHPQVFGQCRQWLSKNLPGATLVEVSSTTEAAVRCADEANAGALASALAADRYHLKVVEENLEDFSDNITRFLVLGTEQPAPTGDDKTSMLFVVRDRVGALYDSLRPLSAHKINLTFIESRPSRRKSWEYYFFVDFYGHISDPVVQQALDELGEHCQFVRILGSYPRAASFEPAKS
mgnify:CR=1 FL=1